MLPESRPSAGVSDGDNLNSAGRTFAVDHTIRKFLEQKSSTGIRAEGPAFGFLRNLGEGSIDLAIKV